MWHDRIAGAVIWFTVCMHTCVGRQALCMDELGEVHALCSADDVAVCRADRGHRA